MRGSHFETVADDSHFETVADDVLDIYKRITGHELDLTLPKEE